MPLRRDLASLLVMTAAAAVFVAPAWRGVWPIPLDDAYIYFAHARAIAEGDPGAWIAGQSYSSGATALAYPFLLAPFWLLGLRGSDLGAAAVAIAVLCLVDLARSLTKLSAHWANRFLIVCVPLLGWSLWSGMEVALFGALMGRALVAVKATATRDVWRRRAAQRRAGMWLAALVVTRPEALPLAAALAAGALWSARSLATASTLLRLGTPAAIALGGQALLQRALTGEWLAAGAIRKGLWSPPDRAASEVVVAFVENLVVVVHQGLLRALGGAPGALVFALLASVALGRRRTRRLALPLAFGIAGGLAFVCANATARFQNYRYVAPLLLMLVALAALGLAGLGPRLRAVAAICALVAPLGELPRQRDHFARASRNIAEQHLAIAERLAALPPGAIFVNDAGAIPYLSGRHAVDGLGLGGSYGLPFARASVAGVPAVIELVERLPPARRPAWLVVYPGWWPGLVDVFGRRVDAVRIDDNVICAAAEKVVYAADWSPLEQRAGLDVGDLVDERAFGHDGAGAIVARLDRGLWDAGRSYATGEREHFVVDRDGPLALASRTDAPATVVVRRLRGEVEQHRAIVRIAAPDGFTWATADLGDARRGDRVEIEVIAGPWRSFHHRFEPR